ncbi:MAG TPA: hypothetical protein VJR89_40520, partial [Polyangiales bacterium]|nr:hypothetical protein [Polyangiales bacterium]
MDWTKIKRSFWGVLRVQLYAAGVGGAIAYASFVHAYDVAQHDFGELAFDMLSGLGGLARGVERVELNGQTFTFAATAIADAPEQVIADFEERCASGSGSLAGDLAGVVAEAREHGYTL